MVPVIQGNGVMIKLVAKETSFIQMEAFTKDNGAIANPMVTVS
jgi:hypothetical protein